MASDPSVQCVFTLHGPNRRPMRILLLILGIFPALSAQQPAQPNNEAPPGSRVHPYVYQGVVQAGVAGFAVNLPASNAPTPTNSGGAMPIAMVRARLEKLLITRDGLAPWRFAEQLPPPVPWAGGR